MQPLERIQIPLLGTLSASLIHGLRKKSKKYIQSFLCFSLVEFLEEKYIHVQFSDAHIKVPLKCLSSNWNTDSTSCSESVDTNSQFALLNWYL